MNTSQTQHLAGLGVKVVLGLYVDTVQLPFISTSDYLHKMAVPVNCYW
jgi:hypothetical protein